MSEITIPYGDTRTLKFTVTNKSDGSARDITGWVLLVTAKRDRDETTDSNSLLSKTIDTIAAPLTGVASTFITKEDSKITPGAYPLGVKAITPGGDYWTVWEGTLIITKNSTKRES